MTYIRRAILAIALIAGLAPVMAQVPPPVPALPDVERRTTYQITASTCACNVNFALYGDSTDYWNWVEVWINGERVNYNDISLGWTITSPTGPLANIARPITDAVLTFAQSQTGNIQIVGARRPRRTSQYQENTGVPTRNFNRDLTDIIAQNRELWDKTNDVTGRATLAPPGETLNTLPTATTRANQMACYDSLGNPAACPPSATVSFPTIADGHLYANATGSPAYPNDTAPATWLDHAFCSTVGYIIARTTGGWVCDNSIPASVKWFGATGNGTTDDTAAFQAAAATGATVFAPCGNYRITSTVSFTGSGQRVDGGGPGCTTVTPAMGADAFSFTGGNRGGGVENILFNAAGMTSGNVISVNNYSRFLINNVSLNSPFNGIFITACNGCMIHTAYMDSIRGGYGIEWFGSSTARSDVLSLVDVIMSGTPATGILMDGNVDTLNIHHVACSACGRGLVTQNTSGGPAPAFIVSHDLEVDTPVAQAIFLAGAFTGGYFANSFLSASQTTEVVNIDAATREVSFTGGRISSGSKQGIFAGGRYIQMAAVNIFANSTAASNTFAGVEIGPASVGVTLTGNHIGQFAGLAVETQKFGVQIDAGAIEYRVVGNDMVGNVTGAVVDAANDYAFSPPRSAVAFNGGSNLNRMGSQAIFGSNPAVDAMSFWGATPATRQTVTGSVSGNVALSTLLTILGGYGLIVNNTTP